MTIHLSHTLAEALQEIEQVAHHEFPVHPQEIIRTDEILTVYGNAKWAIIDLLNQQYSSVLAQPFDLYNWLLGNANDEVAYFLNEAGSNSLTHSQYKAPSIFHLWLGKKGFIIGIEQKGKGFSVEGAGLSTPGGFFNFFKGSKSAVFFDDPREARMVLMQVLISQFITGTQYGFPDLQQ